MNLTDYLEQSRSRLKTRFRARGAAIMLIAALTITLLFAYLFVTLVPSGGWVVAARLFVYLALIGGVCWLFWYPLTDVRTTAHIEARIPGLQGRLSTWRDATARGDDSPVLALLSLDAKGIIGDQAPDDVIPGREIAIPATLAGTALLAVILITAGVTPFQLAAQRLWTGDLFTAAAPRITVSPGDVVIPRGTDVIIEAEAFGFAPRSMQVHADFEGASAQETAPMSYLGRSDTGEDRYGFVFVGVTEGVEYYVGAAGLNSSRHVIHVADLPRVTDVNLEYRFPDWTKLPPRERQNGDVAALADTRISISATTDAPVSDPLIVVNGEAFSASSDPDSAGLLSRGAFTVAEPGSWHVAVMHEGTLARISDTFFIDVVADQAPEVAFSWPGHDTQATSIEERTLRFRATDDFGIQALTLNYAVNGGQWQTAQLAVPAGSDNESAHTLYLEELTVTSAVEGAESRTLKAGDMISFYAEAKDHAQDARTALYFTDIRPFDRTYRESSVSGQQGGQPGSGGANELVQRQREIVTATWNLVNKAGTGEGEATHADAGADADQAEVLALLQRTLRDQVSTLIERAGARRLTMDEAVDTFTQELTAATEDMAPAAEQLEAGALRKAIGPEQQALQHLLAAQATMTDVDVSMGAADMRGTAGRSLSELMDLEMDQERNRYEMPQSPNLSEEAEQQDQEWQRLAELAARQEQLAQQQRQGDESLASRWQQERLQRELEELQRELQRRQQQSGQSSAESRNGQSGDSRSVNNARQERQARESMENAIEELAEARQAIDRSLQQQGDDPRAAQAANRAAAEAIQRASEQLRETALGRMEERLARTERSVENLLSDQRNIMDRLNTVQDDALNAEEGARRFDDYAMEPYADRKRRMQQDLNAIAREIGELGDAIDDPGTSRALEQAAAELARERLDERLAASADAFEFGRPLYAIGNEAAVERALERLGQRLGEARRMLESSEGQAGDTSALAQVRELRAQLGNALAGGGASPGERRQASDTGFGAFDSSDMEALLRQTDALEFRLGQEFGSEFEMDTTRSRLAYQERGTDAANSEALAQLMKDRLDLIEAALVNLESAPIRAQEPRDQQRDSEQVGRYFRDLSSPESSAENRPES